MRGKLALLALDATLISIAYVGAYALRLGAAGTIEHAGTIARTLPVLLGVSLAVHLKHGLFHAILRYASLDTVVAVVRSVLLSVLISCLLLYLLFRLEGVPRSIFVIHGMQALLLVGGARLFVRCLHHRARHTRNSKRVLLYEANDTAELALRGLRRSRDHDYAPVGLIDERPEQAGRQLLGIKVLGDSSQIPYLVSRLEVDEIWVCSRDLPGERLRAIYEATASDGVKIKLLPRLESSLLGNDLARLQEPDIADLLRRRPRSLDRHRMREWICGRRVLITGAGGSIGSELARQVARLGPSTLVLCDSSEAALFQVERDIAARHPRVLRPPCLVDVRDRAPVHRMVARERPEIVFHAAAYKHVPLVELNACEGVRTNIGGLRNVAQAADAFGVRDFVFVSTDKAVRPASVMGATKRAGEILVQILDRESLTTFTAVRFGNVLGSSGSVVPIFQEQIRRGGPVTVTHREMTRYFMLVSEAVELVIQAGSIGRGGEVFILDMGKPVRIADMAKDLIRLMGKEVGRDVQIVYTGARPGERIHEELLVRAEDSRTCFQDIWIDGASSLELDRRAIEARLETVLQAADAGDTDRCLSQLADLVPGFEPTFAQTREAIERQRSATRRAPLAGAGRGRPPVPARARYYGPAVERGAPIARPAGGSKDVATGVPAS